MRYAPPLKEGPLKPKVQQMLSVSVLALALGLGATACTESKPAENEAQSAPAQALGDTVASIKEYAKSDMNPRDGQATTPAQDKVASHFDPSMDATKRSDVISIFADILSIDPNATIDVQPSGIKVAGDTAVINATDLKVVIRGKEQASQGAGGTITLKSESGKWLIADIAFPEAGPGGADEATPGPAGSTPEGTPPR